MRNIGLTENEIAEVISYISENPKIKKAVVYGSRAKGNYKTFSDVDLTLMGDNLDYSDLSRLEDKLYYSYLPYIFDISIFDKLKNTNLIDHIRRLGVIIFDSEEQQKRR
ncbi:MAG: nucleotidyltransferase domain-containing protein [Muribaculaceae bacterium]|nr:nucleotidyltransferase domain-containing protein [Muribaculaceae bacterium]